MKRTALRTSLFAMATVLLTMTAVAAPAHADLGLGDPPATVSSGGVNAFSPQLAVAADGALVVTWYGNVGGFWVVQASQSTDAGVTWDTPVNLSSALGYAFNPQIAVAGDGTIVATWIAAGGANNFAQFATSTDSGATWSPAANLSGPVFDARNAQVFGADDGTIAVSWERDNGADWIVQVTTSTDGGVTWSAVSDASDGGGNADNQEVVVADSGTLVATWSFSNGGGRVVQASRSADGGLTWSLPVDLNTSGGGTYNPKVAASPDGTITLTWQRYGVDSSVIQTSRSTDSGATWSPPFELSVDGVDSYNARIAVAGNGTIVVTWERGTGGVERLVQSATSTNGGVTWSAPDTLSALGFYSDNPQIVVDGNGAFTVTWERDLVGTSIIEVASLTGAGATWSTPLQVSAEGGFVYEAQLAVAASGDVTVVWQLDDGFGNNSIQARTLLLPLAAAPALAATGVDMAPIGLAGAGLLALGAALVIRRRHAASS